MFTTIVIILVHVTALKMSVSCRAVSLLYIPSILLEIHTYLGNRSFWISSHFWRAYCFFVSCIFYFHLLLWLIVHNRSHQSHASCTMVKSYISNYVILNEVVKWLWHCSLWPVTLLCILLVAYRWWKGWDASIQKRSS